jgi:hypothetical protein
MSRNVIETKDKHKIQEIHKQERVQTILQGSHLISYNVQLAKQQELELEFLEGHFTKSKLVIQLVKAQFSFDLLGNSTIVVGFRFGCAWRSFHTINRPLGVSHLL